MLAGCYTLHLYCDSENNVHKHKEFPHTYIDEFGSKCRAKARRDGWQIREGRDLCPKCSGKKQKNDNNVLT